MERVLLPEEGQDFLWEVQEVLALLAASVVVAASVDCSAMAVAGYSLAVAVGYLDDAGQCCFAAALPRLPMAAVDVMGHFL